MSTAGSDVRDGDQDGGGRVDLPQFGVVAQGRDLYLQVQLSTSQYMVYICNINTYEEVARVLHKGIMDAGRDARRAARGIVVAEGADVVRITQRREPDSAS